MPTIFELFGLRFFFYADEHSPIHVHIVKGDAEAKIETVWFENERIYMRSNLTNVYSRPLEVFPTLKEADAVSHPFTRVRNLNTTMRLRPCSPSFRSSMFPRWQGQSVSIRAFCLNIFMG